MIARVSHFLQLWRTFGTAWIVYRAHYALRLRTGAVRRQCPATDWEAQPLDRFLGEASLIRRPQTYYEYRKDRASLFFFRPEDRLAFQNVFAVWDTHDSPEKAADDLAHGIFTYFSQTVAQVGFPPSWHGNPFTRQHTPQDQHWSRIGDFGYGDIKIIWELNRFGFAYTLVRAYWRTGDERYAELFWRLVEDWRAQNPPQQGANWKCGQETSLRVMAWCFGLYGFGDAAATTAERVVMLAQMIAVSGGRIAANLEYALSQRNNHGVSEGVGLWTIGALFPEFHAAEEWRVVGRKVLESQGRELIYNDGSFSQHSVNYHRLMLHDYLWALRLGDLLQLPFSEALKERVCQAGNFLYQIQDHDTGKVPYYGQNDGSLILPFNNCDYLDFRPVVQSIHYLSTEARCYPDGVWDEDLLWLFGLSAVKSPVRPPIVKDLQAVDGGYYTLRSRQGFVFLRCATFRDRPAQADMLHLDLWWRGQNIALDAGTYSYNAPEPWDNPFARTAYHNTVTVNSLDQMGRVGKFLWLPWLKSRVRYSAQSPQHVLAYWEGEHDGYQRLESPVRHRRGVLRLGDEWWLVCDALSSRARHNYRLHWLFPDLAYVWNEKEGCFQLRTAMGAYFVRVGTSAPNCACSLVRACTDSPRGWRAPYYYYREPALSLALEAAAETAHFWTLFGPAPGAIACKGQTMTVTTREWKVIVQLHVPANEATAIVSSASFSGSMDDSLEVSPCTSC